MLIGLMFGNNSLRLYPAGIDPQEAGGRFKPRSIDLDINKFRLQNKELSEHRSIPPAPVDPIYVIAKDRPLSFLSSFAH